ncbi:hypothetical protein [Streptococcus gordonii]|jgi:hypothetical protein|uniref:Uncharacterized protein n=1 Tax=Streptococcus gordonii TaxID=1302 RepID=A0AB34SC42_STRGN|nr:hypothetical protein [Streptococcus gordonii]KJQ65849.1 hypothetical protein TZ88_00542 [Streptococcus gordonii]
MEALELLGLDMDQTEILYNFQFLKTVEDIENEKNQTLKEEKTKWLNEWQNGIELVFSETYQDYIIEWAKDEEELKNWISRKEVESNSIWLDLVTLETYVFEPYYPLNISDKKSKLKFNSKNSWLEEFIVSNFMSKELYSEMKKTYKKSFGKITKKKNFFINTALASLGLALLFTSIGAVFAPQIAVALFGSQFSGLYGAALTNAVLAYIGGGAIAAGGLGVAGGTMVIAGGGALLGLNIGMMSSSTFVLVKEVLVNPTQNIILCSKLLTVVKVFVLNKNNDIELAKLFIMNSIIRS